MKILVYSQKCKKIQNEFQWTTKHVFWQNYFLHMCLALKTLVENDHFAIGPYD
jgi:hypothetical protein